MPVHLFDLCPCALVLGLRVLLMHALARLLRSGLAKALAIGATLAWWVISGSM